jgi:hypothetical protein
LNPATTSSEIFPSRSIACGIDLGLQKRAEHRQEPFALLDGVGRHRRLRRDQQLSRPRCMA